MFPPASVSHSDAARVLFVAATVPFDAARVLFEASRVSFDAARVFFYAARVSFDTATVPFANTRSCQSHLVCQPPPCAPLHALQTLQPDVLVI